VLLQGYLVEGLFQRNRDSKKRRKPRARTYGDTNLTDTTREAVMRTKPGQSHQLIRACESARKFIPVRFSDWGPVSWDSQGKRGIQKQHTQRHRPDKGGNGEKRTSALTLTDGLSRNHRCHFQEDQPGFCNWQCSTAGDPGLRGVQECTELYRPLGRGMRRGSRGEQQRVDRKGCKRARLAVKRGSSACVSG